MLVLQQKEHSSILLSSDFHFLYVYPILHCWNHKFAVTNKGLSHFLQFVSLITFCDRKPRSLMCAISPTLGRIPQFVNVTSKE